jgi:hypothetical protein
MPVHIAKHERKSHIYLSQSDSNKKVGDVPDFVPVHANNNGLLEKHDSEAWQNSFCQGAAERNTEARVFANTT